MVSFKKFISPFVCSNVFCWWCRPSLAVALFISLGCCCPGLAWPRQPRHLFSHTSTPSTKYQIHHYKNTQIQKYRNTQIHIYTWLLLPWPMHLFSDIQCTQGLPLSLPSHRYTNTQVENAQIHESTNTKYTWILSSYDRGKNV